MEDCNFDLEESTIEYRFLNIEKSPVYETLYPFNLALTDCIRRGNVNHDPAGLIDISDLVYLVDYMFTGGQVPPNLDEADVDGIDVIDISD